MAKARVAAGLVAGCLMAWGSNAAAMADPTVAQMLNIRTKQTGIVSTTPADQDGCKVEKIRDGERSIGWWLRDAKGLPVRRFFDSNGDNKLDTYCYYLDGAEVYREIDSNANEKIDQYRWYNGAGARWAYDFNEDGRIDSWKMISPEEVSQEILQALQTRDFARLQALMVTEAELKALELPAAVVTRIRELQSKAQAKFQATLTKLGAQADKLQWLHLETSVPQCIPGDATGSKRDLIKYSPAGILFESGGKHDLLQAGEMIQVGLAWRIVDAPGGSTNDGATSNATVEAIQPFLDELRKIDAEAPRVSDAGPNPGILRYNLARAGVLERIIAKVKPEEQEQWLRQVADCLSTGAQNSPEGDRTAYDRLLKLEEQVVARQAGSALAGYITFREMTAEYAMKLSRKDAKFAEVQDQWLARLAKFVQDYPKFEDTPDALWQLGMVSELVGKEGDAKRWYEHLAKHFTEHPLAPKATGAIARLSLDGKDLVLAGPTLAGSSFDMKQVSGKVAIVYYWASWNHQCVGDFAKLKLLLNTYGPKGVELVTVNLDNTAEEVNGFLQKSPAPGTHLFQPGGLDSPLARQYGIMVLPNLFLVNKEGKVINRNVQMGTLEDEIKKLVN